MDEGDQRRISSLRAHRDESINSIKEKSPPTNTNKKGLNPTNNNNIGTVSIKLSLDEL